MAKPMRLSIVCAETDPLPRASLEYLVLKLNTLQTDVEFEFLPYPTDQGFLYELRPDAIVGYEEFLRKAPSFIKGVKQAMADAARRYDLDAGPVQHVLLISLASLDSHYYEVFEQEQGYSAIFLGEWDERMSPPSILDSLLSLVVAEAIYLLVSSGSHDISHFPTRGCIGDFNARLDDVRYKVLQGFLCSQCREIVQKKVGPESCDRWSKLLEKSWVGSLNDPASPASIVSKLGFNLFLTKGYAPSTQERLLQTLQDEGVKEVLKLVSAILLAAILVFLGLKHG